MNSVNLMADLFTGKAYQFIHKNYSTFTDKMASEWQKPKIGLFCQSVRMQVSNYMVSNCSTI